MGCAPILNGQIVVLFGGENDNGRHDDIYLYSVRDQTFETSKIKCPTSGDYQAFAIHDGKKDEVTTFGYVRDQWKESMIDNHLFPPQYLIKMICGYYWNEWIHLFRIRTCDHHRVDVFDLF